MATERLKKPKVFNRHRWLINQLRRLTLRYPPAFNKVNKIKETYYITSKSGKLLKRVKFKCEMCGRENLKRTEVNLDHIIPVVESTGFSDIGTFLDRLFCEPDNLQLICKDPCHKNKTKLENEERLKNKK